MTRSYGDRLSAWARRLDARAEDVRYPRPEAGGDVCAVRVRPRQAPSARVLVAHGAGNDAVYPLLEIFRALLQDGYEVFSFDLDGHGCGSTTVFAPETVRTCVAAAAGQAERGGPELPLHLIGHSLGGSLVLDALATGALDRAVSATILSAPVDVRIGARTAIAEVRGFFTRATLTQREHYGLWGLVPAFGPVKRAAYPFRRTDADRRAWSYVAAVRRLLADMDLERRVESIRVPTLLVYSYADALVPAGQGLGLSGRMMRAGGNFRGLTRATHYSLPFDPDTLSTVTGWLHAMHSAGEAV